MPTTLPLPTGPVLNPANPIILQPVSLDRFSNKLKLLDPDVIGALLGDGQSTPDGRGLYRTTGKGAVFFSELYGSVFIDKAIFAKWSAPEVTSGKEAGGATVQSYLGLPTRDGEVRPDGVHLGWFERGLIVVRPNAAYIVYGAIYVHYVGLGGPAGWMGLPLSDEQDAPLGGRVSHFDNGDTYWSPATGAHEVHGAIRDRFQATGQITGLGFPLSDELTVNKEGQEIGRMNYFEHGSIYWSGATGAWEITGDMLRFWHGVYGGPGGSLGFPTSEQRTVKFPPPLTNVGEANYTNFQNGVLIGKAGGLLYRITKLDLFIDRFESRGEDNPGPFGIGGTDQDLYVWLTVDSSAGYHNYMRFPNNGDFGADEKQMGQTVLSIPVRDGAMTVQITFEGKDADDTSPDDPLGQITAVHSGANLWDLVAGYTDWHGDFRVFYNLKPDIAYDVDHIREQLYWSFHNFTTPTFSKDEFAQTFSDVGQGDHWYYHPFNALFYDVVYKTLGANGCCFGMCLEAIYARLGHSLSNEPIVRYTLDGIRRNEIEVRHGYQVGGVEVDYFAERFVTGATRDPKCVFLESRDAYRRGDFPLISISNDGTYSKGHALMPYGWNDKDPNRWVIFVANPNNPVTEVASDSAPGNIIEIIGPNTSSPRFNYQHKPNELWTGTNSGGGRMLSIPLHILNEQPRTPFWETLIALVGVSFFLVGDGGRTAEMRASGPIIGPTNDQGIVPLPFYDVPDRTFDMYRVNRSFFDPVRVQGLTHRIQSNGSFSWGMRGPGCGAVLKVTGSAGFDTVYLLGRADAEGRKLVVEAGVGGAARKLDLSLTGPLTTVGNAKRITLGTASLAPQQQLAAKLQGGGEEIVLETSAQPLTVDVSVQNGAALLSRRAVQIDANQTVRLRPSDWRPERLPTSPLELHILDRTNGSILSSRTI